MLLTLALQPEVLAREHFDRLGYRDQIELIFRAFEANTLLVIDPFDFVSKAISDRLALLNAKDGQQLRIRWEELLKRRRQRVVKLPKNRCMCTTSQSITETVMAVHASGFTDALIVNQTSLSTGVENVIEVGSFLYSEMETRRNAWLVELPMLDAMPSQEVNDHLMRLTRFSSRLRLYDKQIGHGDNLKRFHRGIDHILTVWCETRCPFDLANLEIFTVQAKTHEPYDVIRARIRDYLVRPLAENHRITVKIHFKKENGDITHDRFLETEQEIVEFTRGFDFLNDDGTFKRCSMHLKPSAKGHLRDYRALEDATTPITCQPT
jgi:hypothetical protein